MKLSTIHTEEGLAEGLDYLNAFEPVIANEAQIRQGFDSVMAELKAANEDGDPLKIRLARALVEVAQEALRHLDLIKVVKDMAINLIDKIHPGRRYQVDRNDGGGNFNGMAPKVSRSEAQAEALKHLKPLAEAFMASLIGAEPETYKNRAAALNLLRPKDAGKITVKELKELVELYSANTDGIYLYEAKGRFAIRRKPQATDPAKPAGAGPVLPPATDLDVD